MLAVELQNFWRTSAIKFSPVHQSIGEFKRTVFDQFGVNAAVGTKQFPELPASFSFMVCFQARVSVNLVTEAGAKLHRTVFPMTVALPACGLITSGLAKLLCA